jgi:hypothetical protein
VLIRREAGGSGGDRHGKTASGNTNRENAGYFRGAEGFGHGVILWQVLVTPPKT